MVFDIVPANRPEVINETELFYNLSKGVAPDIWKVIFYECAL